MKDHFLQRLTALHLLAITQRLVRFLLRGLWLGMAAGLAAWGLDRLFGWQLQSVFTPRVLWLALPLAVAAALLPWPDRKRLAWRLDRRLDLKEQVTTALQTVQSPQVSPVGALLVEDAGRLIRAASRRAALYGWRLLPDLLSLLVMVILALLAGQSRAFPQGLELPSAAAVPLPPLGQDARASDIFPGGIPGLRNASNTSQARGSYTPEDLDQLRQSLEALGKDLAGQSATYDLGKALQENRLEDAARSMEELAGRLSNLSAESQSRVADALTRAAQNLAGSSLKSLADQLRQAAESIQHGRARDASESLEKLARELRNLSHSQSQQVRAGPGASIGPGGGRGLNGASQPFQRLVGGQGEPVVLAEPHPYLSPVQGQVSSEETLSAPSDRPESQASDFPGAFLVPYSYPWMWRDVVSQYFSH